MSLHGTRWFSLVALGLIVTGACLKAHDHVAFAGGTKAYKFDEYQVGSPPTSQLNSYAAEIQKSSTSLALIIAYGNCAGEAMRHAADAKDFLVAGRSVKASRIKVIDGGCRRNPTVELWIVPKGAGLPTAATRSALPCPRCDAPVAPQTNQLVHITLLFLNNVTQATPLERGAVGGLARIATLRSSILKTSPNTLFLFGGGTLNPSVESNTYKGQQMIDAWNVAGLDVAVFGNHDFDFGPDVLRSRIKESNFTWLGANIYDKTTQSIFADTPPFLIREFSGIKIAIFGIVWPDTRQTSRTGPNLEFSDPCETARKLIPRMEAAGAHFIIALAHLPWSDNKQLVQCAPKINLVMGGAQYVTLESFVNGRALLNVENNSANVGRVDLYFSPDAKDKFDSMEWTQTPVTSEIAENPSVVQVVNRYTAGLGLDEVIGTTSVELDGLSSHSRSQETNLGSFITDAFKDATKADVALLTGGSIRSDVIYKPGPLTRRDLKSILPFQNKLVTLRVTGKVLRAALEHGVATILVERNPGRFPQVSGLKFAFDALRPPGARVLRVQVDDKPLDESATYLLVTSDYVGLNGGDGYSMFNEQMLVPRKEDTDHDALEKAISGKTIAPRVHGRIIRLDQAMGMK